MVWRALKESRKLLLPLGLFSFASLVLRSLQGYVITLEHFSDMYVYCPQPLGNEALEPTGS